MDHLIGRTLKQFKITQALGQGGMGSVYKAQHQRLGHSVALKVMHPHLARQPGFAQRFEQEARVAANLDHPGIVKVQDLVEEDNHFFIVMEFIPGINLAQAIQRMHESGRWIPLDEAIQVIHELALALEYAHNQGVLHRDIKPANVMLKSQSGDAARCMPVITDMGLAKIADSGVVTQMGSVMGSPAYMSPEQAKGETPGPATDIFSLGVVFYELAVGQRPFQAKTLSDALKVHHKQTLPPRPRLLRPSLPHSVEAILLKALAHKPEERYASADELALALTEWTTSTEDKPVQPVAAAEATLMMISQTFKSSCIEMGGKDASDVVRDTGQAVQQDIAQQDMLQIVARNGRTQYINLLDAGTTIGREEGNTIVLDEAKVSRKHLRIERSSNGYQLVDLNSSNGSYLDNAKLLPGIHEPFRPNTQLRIGNFQLYLIPKGTRINIDRTENQPEGSHADPTMMAMPGEMDVEPFDVEPFDLEPEARVRVQIQQTELNVSPGNAATMYVSLQNLTDQAAEYKIDLDGIPAEWVIQPPSLRLPAQAHGAITIVIQPPEEVENIVGSHSFSINVRMLDDDTAMTVHPAVLTVEAHRELALRIEPERKRSSSPAIFTIHVQNKSTTTATVRLSADGSSNECFYKLESNQVELGPGSEQSLQLSVQATLAKTAEHEIQHDVVVMGYIVEEPEQVYKATATWLQKAATTAAPEDKQRSVLPPWPGGPSKRKSERDKLTYRPTAAKGLAEPEPQNVDQRLGWGFWFKWILQTTLASLPALFIGIVSYNPLLVGLVLGFCIGFVQWRLIRNEIKWGPAWIVIMTVAFGFQGIASDPASAFIGWSIIGFLQWVLIRRSVGRFLIWQLVCLSGIMITVVLVEVYSDNGFGNMLPVFIGVISIYALITATALVWILRKPLA